MHNEKPVVTVSFGDSDSSMCADVSVSERYSTAALN